MAPPTDPEKVGDVERGTTDTGSTLSLSENGRKIKEEVPFIGYPDLAHDEVEQMDRGHQEDITREHASILSAS